MLFGQFLHPFHFFLDQGIISFITLEDLNIGKAASASQPLEHLCGSQRAYLFFLKPGILFMSAITHYTCMI
jgi:hypothetical protein